MNAKSETLLKVEDVLDWTYPIRKKGKNYDFVSFRAKDPVTKQLKEKRFSLKQYKKGVVRDTMAAQMIAKILNRLQQNWNPFVPDMEDRSSTLLSKVIAEFKETIEAEVKKNIKKEKTKIDYFSRLKMFSEWAEKHKVMQICHCTAAVVDNYLQGNIVRKGNAARTRNNNRTFLSAFFGWCVKRHYLKDNPCSEIKSVKEAEKQRKPVTPMELEKLRHYLYEKDKHFLLAVMMQYYTLIRPKELSHLKLCDISVKNQTIIVPKNISKNGREEPVALNDRIIKLMLDLGVFNFPNEYYLFGRDFKPTRIYASERIFRERWTKIRKELNIPFNRKFYSLKDSGIIDLINSEGAVNARDQARHTSISVTNLYSVAGGKKVHEETKHFVGKL